MYSNNITQQQSDQICDKTLRTLLGGQNGPECPQHSYYIY